MKLKKGDFIQVTINSVDQRGPRVDTSRWSNIDDAVLSEVGENTSITPGADIYAVVTSVDGGKARLKQKRGVYLRNHLPGDTLRITPSERVSTSFYRAELDKMRNLESLLIAGVSIAADVTVEVVKIRDGTAICLPVTIHHPGLTPGQEIYIETAADTHEAVLTGILGQNDPLNPQFCEMPVKLAEPALATGEATAKITDLNNDKLRVRDVMYPVELPNTGDRLTGDVEIEHTQLEIPLQDDLASIVVEFEHPLPINGTAKIELTDREGGIFQGKILEYIEPPISEGQEVIIKTLPNSHDAILIKILTKGGSLDPPNSGIAINLSEPAIVGSEVIAEITAIPVEELRAKISEYPIEIPAHGEEVSGDVKAGDNGIGVRLSDKTTSIKVEFEYPTPLSGNAQIELTGQEEGVFRGRITSYLNPSIRPGKKYRARVLKTDNQAIIKQNGKRIPVSLVDEVTKMGDADIRILDIKDRITGSIVDEIDPISIDDPDPSNVDLTNLSKL